MDDHFPFFTRLSRYAKTSSSLVGTATRLASEHFLNLSFDEEKQAEALMLTLGNLKGPLMKVAQFLATVPGALPKAYAEKFLTLQTNAPAMGESFVRRRMRGELGENWPDSFQDFDLQPSFAASLGQVHKATLKDGSTVACKLQYPDMETIVEADLQQLRLVLGVYEAFQKGIQTENIFEEIKEKLFEELDYFLEAEALQTYGKIFADHPLISVPKVFTNYSTKRLLTMDFVEGESLMRFTESSLSERNHLARLLFHGWYFPFYHHNVIHGDPHPGNYRVTSVDGKQGLCLLDFGCVRHFNKNFIKGVIHLYEALKKNDRDRMAYAYEMWGFDHLSFEVMEIMSDWAKLLFDPLLDDRIRPIQEKITGWDVASDVHSRLSQCGGVKPPREFVFMDRAAVGIGSVLFHLGAELNWHTLFEELIDTHRDEIPLQAPLE